MTNWTDQNASNLRALLNTTPLVSKLSDIQPTLEGKTLEERAMAASERGGYERCLKELIQLAEQVSREQQKSPYVKNLDQFEEPAKAEQT